MLKRGHVRLLAAMITAIALHALLFTLLPSQNNMLLLPTEGALHVELMAKPEPARAPQQVTKRQHIPTTHTNRKNNAPRQKQAKESALVAVQVSRPVSVQASKRTDKQAESAQNQTAERNPATATEIAKAPETTVAEEAPKQSGTVTTIPQNIQKTILAQVYYPKQARRHGWQGGAEFQFNVHQQTIHEITMLASTGHPILDRAARRGLTSVNRIPLSNGLYRMPVVFRLQ